MNGRPQVFVRWDFQSSSMWWGTRAVFGWRRRTECNFWSCSTFLQASHPPSCMETRHYQLSTFRRIFSSSECVAFQGVQNFIRRPNGMQMYSKGDAKTCSCHRSYVCWCMQTKYQHERAVPAVVLWRFTNLMHALCGQRAHSVRTLSLWFSLE